MTEPSSKDSAKFLSDWTQTSIIIARCACYSDFNVRNLLELVEIEDQRAKAVIIQITKELFEELGPTPDDGEFARKFVLKVLAFIRSQPIVGA